MSEEPKEKERFHSLRGSRLHAKLSSSRLSRIRKSIGSNTSDEDQDPGSLSSRSNSSLNEAQVHDVVGVLKKHNKRYKKDLEALEEAYHEKCQEVWFLSQQLNVYREHYGVLEEIEQMNAELKADEDSDPSDHSSPEHFETKCHFPGDLALSRDSPSMKKQLHYSSRPRDYRAMSVRRPDARAQTPQPTRTTHLANTLPRPLPSEVARAQKEEKVKKANPLNRSYDSVDDSLLRSSKTFSAAELSLLTSPERDFAIVPLENLTKQQKKRHTLMVSQQNQLSHQWSDRKKSKINLSRSKALFTVHNRTGMRIFVSVYDKRRVGVGKHVRISPVYCIDEEELSFEKPFARSTRTRCLLFCRDSKHFDESSLTMNPSLFRTIPSYSIDFSDEVFIYVDPDGALRGSTKAKSRSRREGSKRGSFRSLRSSSPVNTMSINPSDVSMIRKGLELAPEELEFLYQRRKITTNALEMLLGQSLEGHYVPRIAFCGSGGGCRAMVSTLGSLIAAELTGLLDCFTYVAGVSGSTWTLGLWESLALTPSQLRENLIEKFEANLITRPSKRGTSELVKMLRSNWGAKQKDLISLIDIYGAQLSTGLLSDTNPKSSKFKLHHQIPRVVNGAYPLPIYTAVQKDVGTYHSWFEFTPFEVGCTDYETFVPSWGFGRMYDVDGMSSDTMPDPPFGTLLATFGSAFCAPLSRVAEEFFDKLEHGVNAVFNSTSDDEPSPVTSPTTGRKREGSFKSTILDHKEQWNSLIHRMALNNSKIAAPAKFHNFGYDPSKEASKQRNPVLELVDAGLNCNLPFAPLLRPERQVDIIIACNSSKSPNIDRARALRSAVDFCKQKGLKFPPIDLDRTYDNRCSVFRDENDPTCPVIIYFPLKKNPDFSAFDPQENQRSGGYCSTFNFSMSREQVEELSGLTQKTFTQSVDMIKKTIWQVIEGRDQLKKEEAAREEAQAEKEEEEAIQDAIDHAQENDPHENRVCVPHISDEQLAGRESPHGSSKLRMVFTGDQLASAAETRVH